MAVDSPQSQAFELPSNWMEGRERVFGFSVDEPSSPDPDDAVFLQHTPDGKFIVVSIADTTLLPSKTIGRALARGATVYGKSGPLLPMLSRYLSEDKLALGGNELTPTITFQIEVDPKDGLPMNLNIFRGVIEPERITYRALNKAILDRKSSTELGSKAEIFRELTFAIRKTKLIKGTRISTANETIAAVMVATNILGAEYCSNKNVGILYRAYDGVAGGNKDEIAKGYYTPLQVPHAQFGRLYAHFTSPLRRGPDTVCLLQVMADLDGKEPAFDSEDLQRLGIHLTKSYRDAQHYYGHVKKVATITENIEAAA